MPELVASPCRYERSAGRMSLVNNLAKKYSKTLGRELNPLTEIVVTNGASEHIQQQLGGAT